LAKEKIVLIGGGGHCKVVISQLKKLNKFEIAGIVDKEKAAGALINGTEFIGNDEDLENLYQQGIQYAFVTVGSIYDNVKRQELYANVKVIGFKFPVIISPMAIVDENVEISEGTIIMPGCVVNADAVIGKNCIINTGAIIEHDCKIGDHCHIAPGVQMSGGVELGELSFIGVGSSLIQGVKIGRHVTVGAGCVIIDDIPDHSVAMGNPGRITRIKNTVRGGF